MFCKSQNNYNETSFIFIILVIKLYWIITKKIVHTFLFLLIVCLESKFKKIYDYIN